MILAQFSVLPFKNMGLRVWAICQVTGDQWVSREGSLSPSFFFFFLASDAKCQFWVIITRGVTVSELGAWVSSVVVPEESHGSPWRIPFCPRGHFQVTGERWAVAVEPLGWGPFALSPSVGSLPPLSNLYPVTVHVGSSPISHQFLFRKRYSLLGVKHPTVPFLWNRTVSKKKAGAWEGDDEDGGVLQPLIEVLS